MTNQVYANGMEVSCKAAGSKSICALPDVCFTPPQTPATPPGVPVPYPNTGMASDTTSGSTSVQISRQEIMLKDSSYFKRSSGDEAGSAPKKGFVNSQNMGKVYFKAWSMDVKAEGENIARHLDITTHNHASSNSNEGIPWPHIGEQAMAAGGGDCSNEIENERKACEKYEPYKAGGSDVCECAGVSGKYTYSKSSTTKRAKSASADDCMAARRCRLSSFNATPRNGISGCCPGQTGDHLIPKSSFFKKSVLFGRKIDGWKKYDPSKAPCMCLEGGSCTGSHGLRHAHHKATSGISAGTFRSFEEELSHCVKGAKAVAPQCSEKCLKVQLKNGHAAMGDLNSPIKYSPTGRNFMGKIDELLEKIHEMLPHKSGRNRC